MLPMIVFLLIVNATPVKDRSRRCGRAEAVSAEPRWPQESTEGRSRSEPVFWGARFGDYPPQVRVTTGTCSDRTGERQGGSAYGRARPPRGADGAQGVRPPASKLMGRPELEPR